MDVLSDMLGTVRLQTTVFAQTWLKPPWGIRAERQDQFTFHALLQGSGCLEIEGLTGIDVSAGDVVMLAPGRSHALRDRPSRAVRPWEHHAPVSES